MEHQYAIAVATGPILVKYGGNAMPDASAAGFDPTLVEIAELWRQGRPIVLVHGGGPEIDAALAVRGVATSRIDGMRVTDEETLGITEAVLCATINKRIVRALVALGVPAAGISGQDGGTLVARRMESTGGAGLGYVGEIVESDPRLVRALLDADFLPVVAPLAAARGGECAYNVNADLAAAALAGALESQAFVAITNVRRVLRDVDDEDSAIDRLTPSQAEAFAFSPACRSGMRPKMLAAALAVTGGAAASYICAAGSGAVAAALFGGDATIVAQNDNLR